MTSYFREIIFPPKPKPVASISSYPIAGRLPGNINELKARAMFETVYCGKKDKWFSMVECVKCKEGNRTLEEIIDDDIGCFGE